MSNLLEKLQRELEAAQKALVEAEARCARHDAEYEATTRELEEARRKIELAHQEWMSALDVLEDPVFLHDKDYRILRCNRAYQQCAGIPFDQIIGQPYYEVFPRTHTPLRHCLQTMGKNTQGAEDEVTIGETIYRSRSFSIKDNEGKYLYALHILQDITSRKLMDDSLRGSKDLLRSIVENAPIRVFWKDRDLHYLGCNTEFARDAGYSSPDELIGKTDFDMGWKEQAELYRADDRKVIESGQPKLNYEEPQTKPDGQEIWLSTSKVPLRDVQERIIGILGIYQDITERKLAVDKLREREAFIKSVLDNLPIGIAVNSVEPAVAFSYMNDNFPRLYRTTREKLENPDTFWETVYEDPEFIQQIRKQVIEDCATGNPERMVWDDIPITRKGEETTYISAMNIPIPGNSLMISMVWDVTERKHAEQTLLEEKIFSDTLIKNLPDIFFVLDRQGNFLRWSDRTTELAGLSAEEMPKANALAFVHEDDREYIAGKIQEAIETGSALAEARVIAQRGIRYYTFSASRIETRSGPNLLSIGIDITERKQHEIEMRKANRALSLLSECNTVLVHAQNEPQILTDICKLTVETGGYLMAWVGYAEHDENKTVRPVAQSGYEEGYLESVKITWDDSEFGHGPTGTAIRTGTTVVNQHILTNPAMKPWQAAALKRGYKASIALPLIDGGQVLGVLTIYALEPDAFTAEEVRLLEELVSDLAYGIVALRTRKEHEQHAVILRQSLEQSIQTIADTVEARDPYTAGHQRRVAELATAIAQEMGLPKEQINGLHLAAIIHDLGKIHIPAEILSKPSKLSEIEFELIKMHPQEGYNILKDVKFPWPIADIILQHHERMDGSGYPQGLKSDQIILEARILAVADVVEAITSHRPYRPGFGIEAALDEIEHNRGMIYDADAVDACLRLFRERGYKIQD